MLKKIIYLPLLLMSLTIVAQQSTTFSGVTGFTDDGSGNMTSTTSGWNQNMLTSANFIAANDDGSVSYTIASTSDKFAFGLSIATTSIKTKDITYRMLGGKKLYIWENNVQKGNFGNLVIGDVLEIYRVGDQIEFRKNGNLLLLLTTDPSLTLYIKVQTQTGSMVIPNDAVTGDYYEAMEFSFVATHETCVANNIGGIDLSVTKGLPPFTYLWSNGATTEDLIDLASGDYTVTVTDAINEVKSVTITVQKEALWEDASANISLSKNQLLSDTDGNVSYDVDQIGFTKSFGLHDKADTQVPENTDYSFRLESNGNLSIFAGGNQQLGDFGTYQLNDILKIEKVGGQINYLKNGVLLSTAGVDPALTMLARFFLNQSGATLNNISTNFCNIPLEAIFTTTLVSQFLLGGIQLFPTYGTPPYSYVWDYGAITTQNRTDLESGIYNVTISDAASDVIQLKIVVGMELEFANITGIDVINNEELLKTAADGYGNAMTTLNNLVDGDGEVRVEVAALNKKFTFGFREEGEAQATDHTGLDYGLYLDASNNLNSWNQNTQLSASLGTVAVGDVISIQKDGQTIFYKKNDVVVGQDFIRIFTDTIISDTIGNDTTKQNPGLIIAIDETTSTTTIKSLETGELLTCTEPINALIVEGSTVGYEVDATTNEVTKIDFPVPMPAPGGEIPVPTPIPLPDPRLCDVSKEAAMPLFKVDFSLFNTQMRVAKIKVIRFSVIPKVRAQISHAICGIANSADIKVKLRGGVPPYTYSWTGPNSFTASSSEINDIETGLYALTITDSWSMPHVVTNTYRVGYSIQCTAISGAHEEQKDDDLKQGSSLSRSEIDATNTTEGKAESLNQLNPNEDGGVSYEIDQVGFTKTFGLADRDDPQADNYRMRLMNDGTILLLESTGQVAGDFGTHQLGDVVKIERLGSQISYTLNGTSLRLTSTDETKKLIADFNLNETCASFNNLYTDFCNLRLSIDFTVTNESPTGLGSIQLLPKDGVTPYYYFWDDGDQSQERYGLESGFYHVTIVDTTLDSVWVDIAVGVELEFANSIGITTTEDEIESVTLTGGFGNAMTTLNNIVEGDGEISVEINNLALPRVSFAREFAFGLRIINNPQAIGFDGLDFGFYVDESGNLNSFDGGVLTDLGTTAFPDDVLNIQRIGNTIFYKKNGVILRQVDDNSGNIYRLDFTFSTPLMRLSAVIVIKWRFWPRPIAIITNTDCNLPNTTGGIIDLTVIGGLPPYTYNWTGPNGFTATTEDISALDAGSYIVTITDNLLRVTTKTYSVGYEVDWTNIFLASTNPTSSNTLIRDPNLSDHLSGASSVNVLKEGLDGWAEFIINSNIDEQETFGLSEIDVDQTRNSIEYGIYFYKLGAFPFQYRLVTVFENGADKGNVFPLGGKFFTFYNIGDRFRIEKTGTTITYLKNNIVFYTSAIPVPTTKSLIVDASITGMPQSTIKEAITSFRCISLCDILLDISNGKFTSISTNPLGDIIYGITGQHCPNDIIPVSVQVPSGFNINDYTFTWSPIAPTTNANFNCVNPNVCSDVILFPNANGQFSFQMSITSYNGEDVSYCPLNIIDLIVDCEEEPEQPDEIIGCIFGNFGAGVFVGPNVNLNVYCNLLNELGGINSLIIEQGQFVNRGDINVKLDWINNGQNELFINNASIFPFAAKSGKSDFFGDNQNLRGNSSTNFYDLELGEDFSSGNGTKTMQIDQYVYNAMDVQNSELEADNYVMFIENNTPTSVYRGNGPLTTTGGNGYVSTDGVGYLSRMINSTNDYFFPMGSTNNLTRYRPLNIESATTDKYRVNFQNHDPFNDGLTALSPSVTSINDKFYHKINNIGGSSNEVTIQSYFSPNDGIFQALSHWNTNPWWESTVGQGSSIVNVGTGSFDNGLFYAEAKSETTPVNTGPIIFTDEPFVLANAGFVIGTPNWPTTGGGTTGSSNSCIASFTSVNYDPQVVFTNTSSASNSATYFWDFGDGNTSTQQHPTYTYTVNGTYIAQLTVTDGTLSCSNTGTVIITDAGGSPSGTQGGSDPNTGTGNCTASFTSVNYDPQVTFLNTSTGFTTSAVYTWDFGDGNSSVGLTASHTYSSAGTYTAMLTITDGTNICTVTESVVITVAGGVPTGTAGGSVPNGCVATFVYTNYNPQVVLVSTAVVSTNATYLWTLNDGNTATGAVYTHTYATNGIYTVQLDVTDGTGTCSATAVITIINAGGSPVGTPGGSDPNTGTGNCTVSFTSINYDPQITISAGVITGVTTPIYNWNFGDGNFATGPLASHTYANNGTYIISLTIIDATNPSISCTVTETIIISNNSGIVIVVNPDNSGGNGGGTGGNINNPSGTGPGSGPGGNNTSTPNSVPGDYVATITTNDACRLDGEIYFTINPDLSLGVITYSTDLGNTRYTLSEEVYTETIGVPGFTIVATPEELLQSCINSTTVSMGLSPDYILTWNGTNAVEDIIINSPFLVLGFKTDVSGSMMPVSLTPPVNGSVTVQTSGSLLIPNEGSYKFELDLDINGITETVKGQFIAKQ